MIYFCLTFCHQEFKYYNSCDSTMKSSNLLKECEKSVFQNILSVLFSFLALLSKECVFVASNIKSISQVPEVFFQNNVLNVTLLLTNLIIFRKSVKIYQVLTTIITLSLNHLGERYTQKMSYRKAQPRSTVAT